MKDNEEMKTVELIAECLILNDVSAKMALQALQVYFAVILKQSDISYETYLLIMDDVKNDCEVIWK